MKEDELIPRFRDFPSVAVLIATHNPNMEFLREQLNSIARQKYVRKTIYWCDDNSNQENLIEATAIFSEFHHIRVHLPNGKFGVNENFLNLLKAADKTGISHYAFSDQDDLWHPEKLARHIQGLLHHDKEVAASHSKVTAFGIVKKPFVVDRCQSHMLRTLLAENCAQGCTMVLNVHARELVLSADPLGISWYDWWIATVVAIKGKLVLIDGTDTFYRIHEDNLVGVQTLKKRLNRVINRDSGKNLSQAQNLLKFAKDNLELGAEKEIDRWIRGHTGSLMTRVKFALTDRKRRLRTADDFLRRILDLIRIP